MRARTYDAAMLLRHLITLVAGAALLAGCSAEPVADEDKIRIPTVSTPLGPEAAGNQPAKDAKDRKPAKPRKRKQPRPTVVVADQSGIRFTLPRGWTVLGSGQVDYAAEGDHIAGIAAQAGMSTEDFRAMMKSLDVYAIGFSGSLNVAVAAQTSTLPSSAELESAMSQVGAVSGVRDVRTPLGTGRAITYTLNVSTAANQGSALFVSTGGRIVQITATTTDAGQTRSVVDGVARTLGRA